MSRTSSGSFCSLCFMCTGEVERKVWMRGAAGVAHRLTGTVDVVHAGAGEAGDDGILHPLGDGDDRLEVADGGNGEAGLDDVDAHLVEEIGDLQLLLQGHGRARALLAVAQGGVEDEDAVLAGSACGGGHRVSPCCGPRRLLRLTSQALEFQVAVCDPLSAKADKALPVLRGG